MSEILKAGSKIVVSLSIKRLYLTVDEKLISSYPIAIGKPKDLKPGS